MRRLAAIGTAFLAALSMAAAAHADDDRCGYGDFVHFAQDGVAVYKVSPPSQGRAYFHNDGQGCPDAPSCRLKSYLVVQDEVLVSKVENGWACAWYGRGERHTVGWLRKTDLVKSAVAPSGEGDWLGDWSFGDNQITIKRTKKGLWATGDATWTGPASQHVGSFEGLIEVKGAVAEYADREGTEPFCDVRMRRVGNHMVVADSGSCGGASVSFDGVYTR
jgi:hypothetical protein